jgi:hypothetical protein
MYPPNPLSKMILRHQPMRSICMAVSAAIATIAFQSTSHAAQLTYDLRAVSTGVLAGDVTTPSVIIGDGHTVIAADAGSVIVLQLWAILANGNGLNTT